MTQAVTFVPSTISAPSFRATLDGAQYTIVIVWAFFGNRYYASCYDQNNKLIFWTPIIESPIGLTIEALSWDPNAQIVTVTTMEPHGYPICAPVNLVIEGASPSGYAGAFLMTPTGQSTLTFPLTTDPGIAVAFGTLCYYFNIAAGFFTTSTLIYRNGQFIVSP